MKEILGRARVMALSAVTNTVVICTKAFRGGHDLCFARAKPKTGKPDIRLMSGVEKYRRLTSFASNLKNSTFIIFRHQGSSTEIQFKFAREITMKIYFQWNSNIEAQNYMVLCRKLLY